MTRFSPWWIVAGLVLAAPLAAAGDGPKANMPRQQSPQPQAQATAGPIVHIVRAGEKLEMVVNTSRILTLQQKIPQAMVNNPDLLTLTPLSPNQFQVSAKKAGMTQVNLWDEKQQIYTVDVVITGDARELMSLLSSEFPSATIKVRPVASGVLVSGYVDRPEDVDRIKQLAEEYYPKVINNITVAGVQQVLLHIKVYEVSRTKLRQLGFDFIQLSAAGSFVGSSISGILAGGGSTAVSGASTFAFQAVDGGSSFFGVLNALRQNDLAKILSEPTLVAQSGRPAYFRVGGEIPYSVSQGLGAVSIEWKNYGTRLDFVPFVLGNGRIRLEVRPQVSEVDNTRSTVNGVPAIKIRESDTGVELDAGQTLAIAGLVQTRVEAQNRGLPWISEVPYLGALFRRVKEENNEIETLILVTPEIVEALNPHEVPPTLPGENSSSPGDWQLYMLGKLEVANRCPVDGFETIPSEQMQYSSGAGTGNGPDNRHNPSISPHPGASPVTADRGAGLPGFQGPIGYDKGD